MHRYSDTPHPLSGQFCDLTPSPVRRGGTKPPSSRTLLPSPLRRGAGGEVIKQVTAPYQTICRLFGICFLSARGRSPPKVRGNPLLRRRTPWESPYGKNCCAVFREGRCYLSLVSSCIFSMHILYYVCMPSAYGICV